MSKEPTVIQRVAEIQKELMTMKIPKTGMNKFNKFKYYELEDILPPIFMECFKRNLFIDFSFNEERAVLKVIDFNQPGDYIVTNVPYPDVSNLPLNGKTAKNDLIQTEGAFITYLKRYLLINRFLIIEKDYIDATSGAETKPVKKQLKNKQMLLNFEDVTPETVEEEFGSEPTIPEPIQEAIKTIEAKGIEANRDTISAHLNMGKLTQPVRKECIQYLRGLEKVKA